MNSSGEEPPSPGAGVDTNEFLFPGSGLSVLLIHGLTGTPYEMRYQGECLARAGIRAIGVRLAGHGGAPEELGAVTYNEWYESVVEGFERLRSFGDPIVVVGLSAGAVLGARLAEDQGEAVAGLVMLAPAFFLPMWIRAALKVASSCGSWAKRVYMQGGGSDIHDAAAREIHPSNRLMPLSAPLALAELSVAVRSRLGKITQPVLVIHSRRDHVCPYNKNVRFLMTHLGSTDKRAVALDESYHVITVDSERERVAAEIADFIAPMRRSSPPPGRPTSNHTKSGELRHST